MQIVKIEKRDTHITLDLSLNEVHYLKNVLDRVAIEFDSEQEPMIAKSAKWLTDEFYPVIQELSEKIQE